MNNALTVTDVWEKIRLVEENGEALLNGQPLSVPLTPGRDVKVVPIKSLPDKPGLASREGQARLLHDLASIELQAMELGLRTLAEYPEAPPTFREQLLEITREEATHLRLCLEAIDQLGFSWGHWPVHIGLWKAVRSSDDLLDRVLIVHRYLEGSGLDAGELILRRLSGVDNRITIQPVKVIAKDELKHVQFGSYWYRHLCKAQSLDPEVDFKKRLTDLFHRIPRRLEPIQRPLRLQAGFTEGEIETLHQLQRRWFDKENKIHSLPN